MHTHLNPTTLQGKRKEQNKMKRRNLFKVIVGVDAIAEGLAEIVSKSRYIIVTVSHVLLIAISSTIMQ
jgi:hypothetical protein